MINENIAKRKLDKLFADDPEGRAWVWVEVQSKFDERMYGSARWITKEKLKNRKIKYSEQINGIKITLLDTKYNPKTFKYDKPL